MSEQQFGKGDISFQAAGGQAGILKLVEAFYRVMEARTDAKEIRDMHPDDLAVSFDKLARFLCGWMVFGKIRWHSDSTRACAFAHWRSGESRLVNLHGLRA